MELSHYFNLIFIFVLNVLFFFSGIFLNSLVIVTFWRSSLLRRKLCYFMIMVLSCCDVLVVLTYHPLMALVTMLWLTGNLDATPSWADTSSRMTTVFVGFSLLTLLVMNFDRYLATYYPIYHRISVTKEKLLILLALLIILELAFVILSTNDFVLSYQVGLVIFLGILFPPMLFINYKLFAIARKNRQNCKTSANIRRLFSVKNVSSCLLAVACFVVLSIPVFVYCALRMTTKDTFTLDRAYIAALWAHTIVSMNSTCNCLIFYWKNKILRAEGKKVLNRLKLVAKSHLLLTN